MSFHRFKNGIPIVFYPFAITFDYNYALCQMPEKLRALRSHFFNPTSILGKCIKLNILLKTASLKEKTSRTFRAAGKMTETME